MLRGVESWELRFSQQWQKCQQEKCKSVKEWFCVKIKKAEHRNGRDESKKNDCLFIFVCCFLLFFVVLVVPKFAFRFFFFLCSLFAFHSDLNIWTSTVVASSFTATCFTYQHLFDTMALLTPSGGRQILRLKIGDAPKNPFVGHDFIINIHLVDDSGKLKCG